MSNIPSVPGTPHKPIPIRHNPLGLQRTDSQFLSRVIHRASTPPRVPSPVNVKYLPADAFIEEKSSRKVSQSEIVRALTDNTETVPEEEKGVMAYSEMTPRAETASPALVLENGMVFEQ